MYTFPRIPLSVGTRRDNLYSKSQPPAFHPSNPIQINFAYFALFPDHTVDRKL